MISWSSHIYIGKGLKFKKNKTVAAIKNRKLTVGIYCIAYASNPDNLFDIYDANELLLPHYKDYTIHIVGLAKGKQEAYELVQDMLMEVYKRTGRFNVRTYFT